ncbi:unnamed protein product [Medioppia subpectinata]|uniref:CRAL-TRIO domain-containing protein n=1 Tax=Medioppia subpectinata TaxID=1979941 RepID=A0A7R9LGC4_9ACAR|nr:unnamed protein product [Medioppia subpectinata]CAG2118231.1 unnamed protein product [Medioppia subpectinata]
MCCSINMDASDPILLGKVRDKFCNDYKSNASLYDECDLHRLMANDWYVKRFLMAQQLDVDNTVVMIREALRWRKAFGVNDRKDCDFPLEFYKTGAVFAYCPDREGRDVIYLRVKLYRHFPKFSDYFRQYFLHIINKIDVQNEEKGWAMVWDMSGTGPSNWNLSIVRFIISCLRNYYPRGMRYLVIYGVPWIMTAFVNIGLKLVSEEARNVVKFAAKDQIFGFVEAENVPDFLGGKCVQNYHEVPKEAVRDCHDLAAERGINADETDAVLKFYEHYLTD